MNDLQAFRVFSQVSYYVSKLIKSVVYCFYKIISNVSVFYGFTSTINNRLLTNQSVHSMLVFF